MKYGLPDKQAAYASAELQAMMSNIFASDPKKKGPQYSVEDFLPEQWKEEGPFLLDPVAVDDEAERTYLENEDRLRQGRALLDILARALGSRRGAKRVDPTVAPGEDSR